MTHIIRNTVLGAAVAAMTIAAVAPAQADHRHRHRNGDALAAGIAGLAIGAIVGGALAQPRTYDRVYIDPPYYPPAPAYNYRYVEPDYYRPAPGYRTTVRTTVVYDGLEPWTRDWYRACSARYRSFDPHSGTFMGYDGRRHFCNL